MGLLISDQEKGRVERSHSWPPVGRGETGQLCHNTAPSLASLRRHSHLLRSAGNRHAPHYFDSHRATNPATDQPTIAPRHPQTSLLSLSCTPPSPPAKTTRLPVTMVFYTKIFLFISMLDRQNSRALRHQVQKGRGTTSTWRTRLLQAN